MKSLKLVPAKTSIPFIGKRNLAMGLSGLLIIASIVAFMANGLNFGIDFRGGTLIEASAEDAVDICLLYTSPSPRDLSTSRMPSSA